MKTSRGFFLLRASFLTIAICSWISAMAAPRPRFTVTDLGATFPHDINERGDVVGRAETTDNFLPFVYHDGVMTQIRAFQGQGWAVGINDAGAVVGQISGHGFVYRDGALTELNPMVGNSWVVASAINNLGQIIGSTGLTNGIYPAFVLDDGGVQFLPMLPGGFSSQALDINNAGQVVGTCSFVIDSLGTARFHAVLFENDTVTDLGTLPGGLNSGAAAINEAGVAVGWSGFDYDNPNFLNPSHAVVYRDRAVIDLGTLPGDLSSQAHDINNAGWIVGSSEDIAEVARAFLLAGGRLYDLNDLIKRKSGWVLSGATGINDRGQIIGWGIHKGEQRGFLLTPEKP